MGNNLKIITLLLWNNYTEYTFLLGNPAFEEIKLYAITPKTWTKCACVLRCISNFICTFAAETSRAVAFSGLANRAFLRATVVKVRCGRQSLSSKTT